MFIAEKFHIVIKYHYASVVSCPTRLSYFKIPRTEKYGMQCASDGHEDVFEDVVKEDDNDEPLETSCVSSKSGGSADLCPRRSR